MYWHLSPLKQDTFWCSQFFFFCAITSKEEEMIGSQHIKEPQNGIYSGGMFFFDPLLILYVCPLTKKLSVYNFNGRFIWTVRDRITTTKIQNSSLLNVWGWGWCSWGHRQHSSSKHLSWVDAKQLDFDLTDHNTCTQFTSESLANLRQGLDMCFLEQGDLGCAAGFQSFSAYCVTNCFLGDYVLSCLEIIDEILPCSSGLIPHCSYDH